MATVKLSSLRVTADMDASGYVRGVQQKTAADQQAIASTRALGVALAQQDAALGKTVPGMGRLSSQLITGYGDGAKFAATMGAIERALNRGMGADRAAIMIQALTNRTGMAANATDLLNQKLVQTAGIVRSMEQASGTTPIQRRIAGAVGIGGGAGSALESASAFQPIFDKQDQIARLRGEQAGRNFATAFSDSMHANLANKSASESAAVFEQMFSQADQLRARIDPVGAAFKRMSAQVAENNNLFKAGLVTMKQRDAANQQAVQHFNNLENSLKGAAKGGRLMAGEFANLGFQVNDVLTGIALGQSPFMILAQQGGQVYQILANSRQAMEGGLMSAIKATGRGFMDVGGAIVRWFTLGRLAIFGVAGALATATAATRSYLSAQKEVARNLIGAGGASGATPWSIQNIAEANSSNFGAGNLSGLSISEARELATALAATGKIGVESIGQIVAIGKDVERIFGIDGPEAAKLLAESFSDPVKGAEELNKRLGFLSYAMKNQIRDLSEQNRMYEAQQTLLAGVKSQVPANNRIAGFFSLLGTGIANAASDAYDKLGKVLAEATGYGLTLEQELDKVNVELREARKESEAMSRAGLGWLDAAGTKIPGLTAKLEKLNQEMAENKRRADEAKVAQDSIKWGVAVEQAIPELRVRKGIENTLALLRQAQTELAKNPLAVTAFGTREQVDQAVKNFEGGLSTFMSDIEKAITSIQTQIKLGVGAYSPEAKAALARQQIKDQYNAVTNVDRAKVALQSEEAGVLALKQAYEQLRMAQEQRLLSAKQSSDAARLDLQLVGAGVRLSELERANLAAKNALEQEALANGRALGDYDKRKLEDLKAINAEMAKYKQLAAEANLIDQNNFDLIQLTRSETEQTVAAKLRQVYGNDYANQMDGAIAAQIRFNEQMRWGKELATDFASGFVRDIRAGVPAMQALTNAVNRLFDKLLDAAINQLVTRAFGGLIGAGMGNMFGGGASGVQVVPWNQFNSIDATAGLPLRGLYHTGGIVGRGTGQSRYIHPAYFENAPRFHGGGLVGGEVPIIAKRGEGVFTPEQMAAMGGGKVQVNVINNAAGTKTEQRQRREGGVDITDVIISTVNEGMAQGRFDSTLSARHGINPRMRNR